MDFKNVPCVWKPIGGNGVNYSKFVKLVEEKYEAKIDSYWDLHKWSIQNIDKFWSEVWHFAGIKCSKTFDQVIDLSVPMSEVPKWFIGAKLNFAENILRYKDDHVALIAVGEDREKRVVTYAQLHEEVKRYAAAFRKFGLKKGDRIVGYLSNREEGLFAMLGANTVGAVWATILPLIGSQAALDKLKVVDPSIIISVDGMKYNQEEIDMLPKLKKISEGLPTLTKVIIVPSKPDSVKKDISGIPKSCFLEDFLDYGQEMDGTIPEIIFEQMDFSDPLTINYTSGTTGPPKALIQDHGVLIVFAKESIMNDFTRQQVGLAAAPPGWTIWILGVLSFFNGNTNVLFDGLPYTISQTYLWDLVDEYKITSLVIFPSILDEMEKKGYVPTEKHKLSSLSAIFSGAAVVRPQNFDFVYQKIKPGIMFGGLYGSSEAGCCIAFHRELPIYRGELSCPSLGVDIRCVDETGKAVEGIGGDLVLAKPVPMLPRYILKDIDRTSYKKKYFPKFPDKFSMNDIGIINPETKGTIIVGRSDEILKPGGFIFGSVEIYNIVNQLPEVHDSLCVSQYSNSKNERAVLFLKVREGFKFGNELVKKVQLKIKEEMSINHVPGLIMEVKAIPLNINGKKMEILVKKIINKMPYNSELVINKDSLECFQNVPPFED